MTVLMGGGDNGRCKLSVSGFRHQHLHTFIFVLPINMVEVPSLARYVKNSFKATTEATRDSLTPFHRYLSKIIFSLDRFATWNRDM